MWKLMKAHKHKRRRCQGSRRSATGKHEDIVGSKQAGENQGSRHPVERGAQVSFEDASERGQEQGKQAHSVARKDRASPG